MLLKINVIVANCTQGILLILNVVGEFRAEAGLLQVVTVQVLTGDRILEMYIWEIIVTIILTRYKGWAVSVVSSYCFLFLPFPLLIH